VAGRTEGYAEKFLDHQPLNPGDSIVIFGHVCCKVEPTPKDLGLPRSSAGQPRSWTHDRVGVIILQS
jgi:hypothetical protein